MMDPLDTETSRFWQNFGPQNPSIRPSIQTEVFQPADHVLRRGGRLAGQFGALAAMALEGAPSRRARRRADIWIMAGIFHRLRELYRKEGGAFPDPILNLTWHYTDPDEPDPEELAKEINGRALADLKDPTGAVTLQGRPAAGWLRAVARRRHDRVRLLDLLRQLDRGGQPDGAARRDRSARAGIAPNWAWAWPANRRILYNRASADPAGKPWNPAKADHRMERQATGSASTCPTIRPTTSRPTAWVRSS